MLGLYEKTKLGTTRKIPELKIFSFIGQVGVDTNNWTHHMGRMEPNLLPRPFVIFICKGRRVTGLPNRQLRNRKDRTERRTQDIYVGDGAVCVDGLATFKDSVTMKIFLTYTVCLLAIYFDLKKKN